LKVLVTGGAGFIGSFIVDKLVEKGHSVRIFDNLEPQVHEGAMPEYLNKKAEIFDGDIRNCDQIQKAIEDQEVIFHQAAAVGVGQSMYQISKYVEINTLGTANLFDILVNSQHKVRKVIVAASMSSYGEGSYDCENCGIIFPDMRTGQQLKAERWELECPKCQKPLKPIPTKETKYQNCKSIYAMTKKDQEDIALTVGKAYNIPTVALRYFNVYGPRQSLSNPYTGVVAIFMSRIKNDNPPIVYEDGMQTRDFVSVHDIVQANMLAMELDEANYEVFNVGSGQPRAIKEIGEILAKLYGKEITPQATKEFRKGDIRHCFADISKLKDKLGYEPRILFEEGMKELIEWSRRIEAEDKFEQATKELKARGLI